MLNPIFRQFTKFRGSQLAVVATISIVIAGCGGSSSSSGGSNKFTLTKLVADTSGPAAAHTDANLVNPWGMSANPGGPWSVSDNGSGKSTLYGSDGTINSLVINIPGSAGNLNGPVSGQVYNNTIDFVVSGLGPSKFIFVTEDGVLSAWYSGANAVIESDQSSTGSVYKGLDLATNGTANYLYATNFHSGMIDVFDKSFTKTNSFTDSAIPTGFGPFGIQVINNLIYVTFAQQDGAKKNSVAGAGLGYVDVFNLDGTLNKRLISGGALNSPWGIVQAPTVFGSLASTLLVGNFGDGKINAYNIANGNFIGTVNDSTGVPIVIPGLWGLTFGNGTLAGPTTTLFFTSGPNSEANGLFGSIVPSP